MRSTNPVSGWRALAPSRRLPWFALLLFAGILVTGPLLLLLGNRLLQLGLLASPGPFGAPLLVEVVFLVSASWLAASWGALTRPDSNPDRATAKPAAA